MSWVSDVAVGAVVVVAVVGGVLWLARRGTFQQDSGDETGAEREELAESVGQQDFHIPFRRRIKTWSAPYKVFVGSLVLLGFGAGFAAYQVMKTGSPAHQYITREVRFAAVAVLGIGGGARLRAWSNNQIGHLDVAYERDGKEPVVERIPYLKGSERVRDGCVVVSEVAENRLFGLFWRFKQVGEDRRLRAEDKPLDDVIQHQIPEHGVERPDGSGYYVMTSQNGDTTLSGATSVADVTYSSPNSLSDERATQIREEKKRMKARLNATKATNAELYQRIDKLEKSIRNDEYDDRTQLMEDLDRFAGFLSTFRVELDDKSKNGNGSALEDDGKQEATA